ncbi:MAG: COX15/CtaA family protein [Bdellovibrio sp.]|nr:COX15/CtaA family protein [Methylotenera sp.]
MRIFSKLTVIAACLALFVVVLGAYVRLSDAGLGCPDWPGCYGTLTVPQSESALLHAQIAYPDSPVEHPKAWKEMIHRYFAGALGVLVAAIFVLGWRARKHINVSPWLTTFLAALIVMQAAFGMWTVTMKLMPLVVTTHLMGGMSTLALLAWMAHRQRGLWSARYLQAESLRPWVRGALLVIFAQIFLGGWTSTNYAWSACTDFPTCHGAWFPNMDFANAFDWVRELGLDAKGNTLQLTAYTAIQWTHRVGALVTFLYLGWLGLRLLKEPQLKKLAHIMLGLLAIQIALGVATLLLHLPLVLAVGHNMVAALLLTTIVVINSKITE